MEKQEDLMKIELKVHVHCCDGCKKKVLKALSIKGVLKMEIHPTQPKVTVMGNVNAETLIKKLAKCGKVAELLPSESKKQDTEGKQQGYVNINMTKKEDAKEKPIKEANCEKKSSNQCHAETTKIVEAERSEKNHKEAKFNSTCEVIKPVNSIPPPHMNYLMMNPAMMQPPQNQVCYSTVEPQSMVVPMTYYMANSCSAPPPYCNMIQPCYHGMPINHVPAVHPQPSRVMDYFNDENTAGCHVM